MSKKYTHKIVRWGILWRSKNKLDGKTEQLMFLNCEPLLFSTRREAKEYIKKEYGYIIHRIDLQNEPFGWKLPRPIRLLISMNSMEKP